MTGTYRQTMVFTYDGFEQTRRRAKTRSELKPINRRIQRREHREITRDAVRSFYVDGADDLYRYLDMEDYYDDNRFIEPDFDETEDPSMFFMDEMDYFDPFADIDYDPWDYSSVSHYDWHLDPEIEDTSFRNGNVQHAIKLAKSLGYEDAAVFNVTEPEHGYAEKLIVMAHPAGLLLTIETYHERIINTIKLHYAVNRTNRFMTSSGTYYDGVWLGDHDVRDGLKAVHNMVLDNEPKAIWPVPKHHLWLVSYADHRDEKGNNINGFNFDTLINSRIEELPSWVKAMIAH